MDDGPRLNSEEISAVNVLDLLLFGEELLSSFMRGISETLNLGRVTAFPVDKEHLKVLTQRLQNMPELLNGISGIVRRLRITEDLLNLAVPESLSIEEIAPFQIDPLGNVPIPMEKELQNYVVDKQLWKEYAELQEKLTKQDAYIKVIIDAERMFLQEVNCVFHP